MLPLLARTSLAIGLGCASLTAQFLLAAKDVVVPSAPPLPPVPNAAVRHGNTVVGINNITRTWNPGTSTWNPSLSIPPISSAHMFVTRSNAALGWDPIGGSLVQFSGTAWVSQPWTLGSSPPPAARAHFRMAALPNNQVLMFGGEDAAQQTVNETWVLSPPSSPGSPNVWIQVFPATSPPPRASFGMAEDGAGGVVLFGGYSTQTSSHLGDTWLFSGGNWTQLFPSTSPGARALHGLTFFPVTGTIVLVGGVASTTFADAWQFNGANWTAFATSTYTPPPTNGATTFGAAWDPVSREVVQPTIASDRVVLASASGFRSLGTGCVCDGPQPAPFLDIPSGTTTLGGTWSIGFANYTPATLTTFNPLFFIWDVVAAAPAVQFPGLPFGCLQQPFSTANVLLVSVAPPASPAPAIPPQAVGSTPNWLGQRFFVQGVQAPLSGFLGCSSNGTEVHIGR